MVNGLSSTVNYVPDDANRLATVNGVTYTWDNNGNLLNDGVNTYTYDVANHLKTLTGPSVAASYSYSGLGDRLQETIGEQTTTFTMDLNAGLTQALSDGTNTYIYGNGRIAQVNTSTEYFLGDALGSVRQLTDNSGAVTYASAYDPYGVTTQSYGASQTAYGYTNEYMSQGLIYLRSRFYSPETGRFQTRDTWQGDYNRPLSLNRWMYGYGNPVNFTDPSGMCVDPDGTVHLFKKPWGWTLPCEPSTTSTPAATITPAVTAIATAAIACPVPAATFTSTPTPPTGGLSLDDIKILTVFIAGESHSGAVPDYVSDMKAWALLNLYTWNRLDPNKKDWTPFKSWKHHERNLISMTFGINAPDNINNNEALAMQYDKTELLKWYMKGRAGQWTRLTAARFIEIEMVVNRSVWAWASNGSRSPADPVHGAVDFTDAEGLCFSDGGRGDICPGQGTADNPYRTFQNLGATYVNVRRDFTTMEEWRKKFWLNESTTSYQVGIDTNHNNDPVYTFTRFKQPPGGWPK